MIALFVVILVFIVAFVVGWVSAPKFKKSVIPPTPVSDFYEHLQRAISDPSYLRRVAEDIEKHYDVLVEFVGSDES